MGLALDTYSIFFDSCLGEERSLFEFEAVIFRELPGRDPSLFIISICGMLNHL